MYKFKTWKACIKDCGTEMIVPNEKLVHCNYISLTCFVVDELYYIWEKTHQPNTSMK